MSVCLCDRRGANGVNCRCSCVYDRYYLRCSSCRPDPVFIDDVGLADQPVEVVALKLALD